jgi:hypothetical protein
MGEKAKEYKHLKKLLLEHLDGKSPSEHISKEMLEYNGRTLELQALLYSLAPVVYEERINEIQNDYPIGKQKKPSNEALVTMKVEMANAIEFMETLKNSMLNISMRLNRE